MLSDQLDTVNTIIPILCSVRNRNSSQSCWCSATQTNNLSHEAIRAEVILTGKGRKALKQHPESTGDPYRRVGVRSP